MKVIKLLRKTRALLKNPKRWTQNAYARNKINVPCSSTNETACSFCLLGAMWRTSVEKCDYYAFQNACTELTSTLRTNDNYYLTLQIYNDTHTHKEILTLLDRTIKAIDAG